MGVALRRSGMSLADVAEQMGIGRATLSRTINGHRSPTVDELTAFARIVGCEVAQLVAPPIPAP